MTTITSEEELAINIDDKKETSEQVKHFFSLDRNHRSKQKTCMQNLLEFRMRKLFACPSRGP